MPKETYIIEIYRPYNCNIGLTKQYIGDAINHFKGAFDVEDERIGIELLNITKKRKD